MHDIVYTVVMTRQEIHKKKMSALPTTMWSCDINFTYKGNTKINICTYMHTCDIIQKQLLLADIKWTMHYILAS